MEDSKGKWWDSEKERNKVKGLDETNIIEARYDRIKDWRMDTIGYFLIKINKDKQIIEAGFCRKENKVEKVIIGKTAMEVFNNQKKEKK